MYDIQETEGEESLEDLIKGEKPLEVVLCHPQVLSYFRLSKSILFNYLLAPGTFKAAIDWILTPEYFGKSCYRHVLKILFGVFENCSTNYQSQIYNHQEIVPKILNFIYSSNYDNPFLAGHFQRLLESLTRDSKGAFLSKIPELPLFIAQNIKTIAMRECFFHLVTQFSDDFGFNSEMIKKSLSTLSKENGDLLISAYNNIIFDKPEFIGLFSTIEILSSLFEIAVDIKSSVILSSKTFQLINSIYEQLPNIIPESTLKEKENDNLSEESSISLENNNSQNQSTDFNKAIRFGIKEANLDFENKTYHNEFTELLEKFRPEFDFETRPFDSRIPNALRVFKTLVPRYIVGLVEDKKYFFMGAEIFLTVQKAPIDQLVTVVNDTQILSKIMENFPTTSSTNGYIAKLAKTLNSLLLVHSAKNIQKPEGWNSFFENIVKPRSKLIESTFGVSTPSLPSTPVDQRNDLVFDFIPAEESVASPRTSPKPDDRSSGSSDDDYIFDVYGDGDLLITKDNYFSSVEEEYNDDDDAF